MKQKSEPIERYLLTAKVQPVRLRTEIARKTSISALLDQAKQFPLTFVEAPAGYGKTVLLHQWAEIIEMQGDVVLWLFLDEEDTGETINDYLHFAARISDSGILDKNGSVERSIDQPQTFTRFSNFLAQLEQSGRKIYLFFDDAERLQDASAVKVINFLVERVPYNVTLVMAGRQNPGIDLTSLELSGNVLQLTTAHLQFKETDYKSFFNVDIPTSLAALIEEKTEGWGAALQMIKIAVRKAHDKTFKEVIETFSGKSDLPAQYIGNQIYSDIPRETQIYLNMLGVIEWFDQDIAAEMTGSDQDLSALIHSEQLSGFFGATNSSNTTYRMHGLLREYCLQQLKVQSLESYRQQHRLAARIMAGRGHMVKALKHALEGDQDDLFVEIFETCGGLKIWLREGMRRLTEAVSLFRPGMNIQYPRLGLAECIVLIKQSKLNEARLLLDKITSVVGDFSDEANSTTPEAVALDYNFIQAMMAVYGCRDLNPEFVNSILLSTNPELEDQIVLGHNQTLLCVAHAQKANFGAARKRGYEAIDHFRNASSQYGIFFIELHLGAIDMACGRTADASKRYDKARRLAKREFHQDPGPKLIGDVLSFELAVERAHRTGLNGRLSNILNRIHTNEAWLDIYIAAYVAAGAYLKQVSAFDKLDSLLEDGLDHASQTGINRLHEIIWLVKTDVLIAQDKIEEAGEAYEMNDLRNFDTQNLSFEDFSWREVELNAWVLINLDIGRGNLAQARENALIFAAFAKEAGVTRSYIKAMSLLTVIDVRLDDFPSALAHLNIVYPYLEKSGFYSTHHRFRDDFNRLREQGMDSAPAEHFAGLLEELEAQDSASEEIRFSEHEKVVIDHLRNGLQDKQIARKIGLTEHAVRYHLKKIYQKVHAGNRTEAIRNIDKIAP